MFIPLSDFPNPGGRPGGFLAGLPGLARIEDLQTPNVGRRVIQAGSKTPNDRSAMWRFPWLARPPVVYDSFFRKQLLGGPLR